MIDHFFVSRKLTGKNFQESFKAIELYCHERKQFLSDPNLNQPTISSELARELNVFLLKKDNNLEKLLNAFGQSRTPLPIEQLVYFTARCLAPYFLTYNQYIRQNCESELVVSDFRVGTAISSMPFIFLLFDLVLTGNERVSTKRGLHHLAYHLAYLWLTVGLLLDHCWPTCGPLLAYLACKWCTCSLPYLFLFSFVYQTFVRGAIH